jgi:hypothetical protein
MTCALAEALSVSLTLLLLFALGGELAPPLPVEDRFLPLDDEDLCNDDDCLSPPRDDLGSMPSSVAENLEDSTKLLMPDGVGETGVAAVEAFLLTACLDDEERLPATSVVVGSESSPPFSLAPLLGLV